MLAVMACTALKRRVRVRASSITNEQHAQAKRNFRRQEGRRRNAIGERRPGKMKEGQRQSQQPCRGFPASAARAQQSDRCREQNDAVADFDGHAQGQGIGPQQDSGAGKPYQNGRDHRQGKDQVAAARVEQNRSRQQSHGEHEGCLHRDQIEGRGNFRREAVLGQARSRQRPPNPESKA